MIWQGDQSVLVLATISSLPSLPPPFCRDSRAKVTNNNSRALHSQVQADAVLKPWAVAISIVQVAAIMIKVQAVLVLWMIPMLVA
jgi:hypothetical protein